MFNFPELQNDKVHEELFSQNPMDLEQSKPISWFEASALAPKPEAPKPPVEVSPEPVYVFQFR